jgi:hypothetical protein
MTVPPEVWNRLDSNSCPPMITVSAVPTVTAAVPIPMSLNSVPTPMVRITLVIELTLVARSASVAKSRLDCAVVGEMTQVSLDAMTVEIDATDAPVRVGVVTDKVLAAILYPLNL